MPTLLTQGAASARAYGFGASSAPPVYIEDVFSTYLYTGTGGSQTITNGIDLSTKGGMVWIKSRSDGTSNFLFDTARGTQKEINSNTTDAEVALPYSLGPFNTNGFTIGNATGIGVAAATYASWTFRKQPKFFDVVTWVGDGSTDRLVSHNLTSVPGAIFVKATSTTSDWFAVTRINDTNYAIGDNNTGVPAYALNQTGYFQVGVSQSVIADSSSFNVAKIVDQASSAGFDATKTNANGVTYVAYLFAHNAGGFGLTGTDNVISCGSYTGTGVAGNFVSLGYEPQWVLIKRANAQQDWFLFDNMRGIVTGTGGDLYLNPNTSGAEGASGTYIAANATGFTLEGTTSGFNASGGTYIYIAIRRGPMKTPTTGTSVFQPITETGDIPSTTFSAIGFPFDAVFNSATGGTYGGNAAFANRLSSRLTGLGTTSSQALITSNTTAEASYSYTRWDPPTFSVSTGWTATKFIWYFLLRAPGFFDVVCYTGTGSAITIPHNLSVKPELIIQRSRNNADNWSVFAVQNGFGTLNSTAAWGGTGNGSGTDTIWQATSSTIALNSTFASAFAISGWTNVAYLFATVAGVSKVGTYTGTAALQTINCGFTGGARFVLIKRTDSTGDWYVWDSARGISSGNDPYLLLNSTAAEVTGTNYVGTTSIGFQVTSAASTTVNVSGGSYIFLAIA